MKPKIKKAVITGLAAMLAVIIAYGVAATVTLASEYEGEGGFAAFSDVASRLFSDPLSLTFKKTVYKLFGVVTDKNVSKGYGGYLFPTKTDDFDYAADIAGKAHYDGETKQRFLYSLTARQNALARDGCGFYVFVIPNSQTVLRDKLKAKNKDGVTAAQDLETYLHENGFYNFYLLTDALSDKEYDTYNNTENSVNGYGAYLIYRNIAERLPESVLRRCRLLTLDNADISVSYSNGGTLAKKAGIEKLIKNKNVLYKSTKFTSCYSQDLINGFTVCTLKEQYNEFIGRSSVLLQIPDSERTLLLPLFSASFTDTVYNNSLSYSYTAVSAAKPSVNVCILREDRLISLINGDDIKTYEARIENEDLSDVTKTPEITSVSYKQSGTAFVAGNCEDGAAVTVTSGQGSVTAVCKNGLFITEVPAERGEELYVYAEADGKAKSDTAKGSVPATVSAEENVFAGGASTLYYGETVSDYTGANLLKTAQIERIKNKYASIVEKVREASGKDTEIIFLTAPDPLSVYPEYASERHRAKRADITRLDQFGEALSGVDGVTFLDVRGVMRQNTDIGKLYYQTDTHWTETGAYFGYRAIVEAAGQTPHPLGSFETEETSAPSGDLSSFAGLTGLTETVKFLKPLFELKAKGVENKPDSIDRSLYSDVLESKTEDEDLPSALMIRDSYSANLFPFICEHFRRLYCQSMWDYEPDYEKITEIKPDYVIYVICERNIGSLR